MAKVLLVEDDKNLREIYEARLQAEGYEISSANDGEEALVVAKEKKPDLIIADVMMPKISGFEMLDILKNTEGMQDVKVIMLTALGQAEDQQKASSLGADRYLVKSQVTLEDIVNATHELLESDDVATPAPAAPQAQDQPDNNAAAEPAAAPATDTMTPAVEPMTEPMPATPPTPEPETTTSSAPAEEPTPDPISTSEPAPTQSADNPATLPNTAKTDDKLLDNAVTSLGGSDSPAADPAMDAQQTDMPSTDTGMPEVSTDPMTTPTPTSTDSAAAPVANNALAMNPGLNDQLAKENMTMTSPYSGSDPVQGAEAPDMAAAAIEPKPDESSDHPASTDGSLVESNSGSSMKVIKPMSEASEKTDINTLLAQENMNPTASSSSDNTPPPPTDPDQAQVVNPDAGTGPSPTPSVSPNDVAL